MTIETTDQTPSDLDRPRLRHDVAFLETLEGVYVRGRNTAFVVRGAGAYRYLSALLPYLDGGTAFEEIISGLPEAQGNTVRSLLGTLAAKGVLTDGPHPGDMFDEQTRTRYASQLALLDHYGDDGSGLGRALSARVVIVCDDEVAATALADSLRANGVGAADDGYVRVADTGQADAVAAATDGAETADLISLVALDRPHPRLLAIADTARRHGSHFVPLLRIGERLVLGPRHGSTGAADVTSTVMRMSDNQISGTEAIWQAVGLGRRNSVSKAPCASPWPALSETVESIALTTTGFEIFKALTGVLPDDLTDAAVVIDPERLTTVREHVLPHPVTHTGTEPAPSQSPAAGTNPIRTDHEPVGSHDGGPTRSGDGAELDLEEAYRRFEPAIAATVGIFRQFDDDALPQIPVKVARVVAPAAGKEPVVAFGTETVLEARLAALELAAATYTVGMQRRRPLMPTADDSDAERVRDDAMATWLGGDLLRRSTSPDGDVAATDLSDGGTLAVPREAVLASPWDARAARFEPTLTGVAAGPSPAEATSRALLDAVGGETVAAIARGVLPVHRVEVDEIDDQAAVGLRDQLEFLVRELTAGGTVRLFHARSAVPAAVVHVDDGRATHAVVRTGRTWASAAYEALLAVAGGKQLGADATPVQPTHHLAGASLDGAIIASPAAGLPESTDDERILRELRDQDRRAALVDLTPPDLAGITSVARVLLFRDWPS